jgi:tetratricopeptide (TPR) repeat protein
VIFAGGLTDDDCLAAETAIRNDPWDLGSLKRYASCEALRGEAAEAETAFRRLLTFTPEDPDAELGLAAVRHEQGFASEAAATYQRLLEDATGDAEAARLRALLALAAAGR